MFNEIEWFFAQMDSYVQLSNGQGKTDINTTLEDVIRDIIEVVGLDTNVKNMNHTKANFPGYDLEGDNNVYQITSTVTNTKIRKSIEKIDKGNNKPIYFIFLSSSIAKAVKDKKDDYSQQNIHLLSFKEIISFTKENKRENELQSYIKNRRNGELKTLEDIEEEIVKNKVEGYNLTLNFYDYEDSEFEDGIRRFLESNEHELYIKSEIRDEAELCVVSTIKKILQNGEISLLEKNTICHFSDKELDFFSSNITYDILICSNNSPLNSIKKIIILSSDEELNEMCNTIQFPRINFYNRVKKLEEVLGDYEKAYKMCKDTYNQYHLIRSNLYKVDVNTSEFFKSGKFVNENYLLFKLAMIGGFKTDSYYYDTKSINEFLGTNFQVARIIMGNEYDLNFSHYVRTERLICTNRINMLNLMIDYVEQSVIKECLDFFDNVLFSSQYNKNIVNHSGIPYVDKSKYVEKMYSSLILDEVIKCLFILKFKVDTKKHFTVINDYIKKMMTRAFATNDETVLRQFISNSYQFIELNPIHFLDCAIESIKTNEITKSLIDKNIRHIIFSDKTTNNMSSLISSVEKLLYTEFSSDAINFFTEVYSYIDNQKLCDDIVGICSKFFNPRSIFYDVKLEKKRDILFSISNSSFKKIIFQTIFKSNIGVNWANEPTYLNKNDKIVITNRQLYDMVKQYISYYLSLDLKLNDLVVLLENKTMVYVYKEVDVFNSKLDNIKFDNDELFVFKSKVRERIATSEEFKESWKIPDEVIKLLNDIYCRYDYLEDSNMYQNLEFFTSYNAIISSDGIEIEGKNSYYNRHIRLEERQMMIIKNSKEEELVKMLNLMIRIGGFENRMYTFALIMGKYQKLSIKELLNISFKEANEQKYFINNYVRGLVRSSNSNIYDIVAMFESFSIELDEFKEYFKNVNIDNTVINLKPSIMNELLLNLNFQITDNFTKNDALVAIEYFNKNDMYDYSLVILYENTELHNDENIQLIIEVLGEVKFDIMQEIINKDSSVSYHIKSLFEFILSVVDIHNENIGKYVFKFYSILEYELEQSKNEELLYKLEEFIFNSPNIICYLASKIYKDDNGKSPSEKIGNSYLEFVMPIFKNNIIIFRKKSIAEINDFKNTLFHISREYNIINVIDCIYHYHLSVYLKELILDKNYSLVNDIDPLLDELSSNEKSIYYRMFYNSQGIEHDHVSQPYQSTKNRIAEYKTIISELANPSGFIANILDDVCASLEEFVRQREEYDVNE